jgi:hypothetical protein
MLLQPASIQLHAETRSPTPCAAEGEHKQATVPGCTPAEATDPTRRLGPEAMTNLPLQLTSFKGDLTTARALFEARLAIGREVGAKQFMGFSLRMLGRWEARQYAMEHKLIQVLHCIMTCRFVFHNLSTMAGSPRALTPPTCTRRRHCLQSCPDLCPHGGH